ncbi:MAG: molybdenum ABC transporter ATP-binding protein [Cypionkella sp.]
MTVNVTLSHRFAGFALDVAFEAPAGVTALFGPSGSGKTSIVNAVAGLLRPDRGCITSGVQVLLDTEARINLPPQRRRIGYVFQDARLFPHLNVRQNLLYGRWFAAKTDGVDFDRVVTMLDIARLLSRRPATLSGGERQRVAIGRALLANPQILLMDEPLAALDDARKAEILPYIEQLRDQTRIPILYVSHSVSEIARLAGSVVLLEAGRVLRTGTVAEVFSDPSVVSAVGLRDAGSVIDARIVAQDEDGLTRLQTSAGLIWLPRIAGTPGATVRVRIAAQDVILASQRPEGLSALNILPATVVALRLGDGPGAMVQLRVGEDLLLARITRRSASNLNLAVGGDVFAVLKSVAVAPGDIGAAHPGALTQGQEAAD